MHLILVALRTPLTYHCHVGISAVLRAVSRPHNTASAMILRCLVPSKYGGVEGLANGPCWQMGYSLSLYGDGTEYEYITCKNIDTNRRHIF